MNLLRQFVPRALLFLTVFAVVAQSGEAREVCRGGAPGPWWSYIKCNGQQIEELGPFKNQNQAYDAGKKYCDDHGECDPCTHTEKQVPVPLRQMRRRFTVTATCGAFRESASAATMSAAKRQAVRKLNRTLKKCGVDAVCACGCVTLSASQNCQ